MQFWCDAPQESLLLIFCNQRIFEPFVVYANHSISWSRQLFSSYEHIYSDEQEIPQTDMMRAYQIAVSTICSLIEILSF